MALYIDTSIHEYMYARTHAYTLSLSYIHAHTHMMYI